MVQTPADVFLERLNGAALAGALLLQAFWAVALLGAAQALVALATRRVVIQGG
jgi:ABC-2 type transport system permease protein